MPVDTSMYGMIKPIDIVGSVERGLNMRDMIGERKKKSAVQDAYKQGMKVGPDGKVSMDHNLTASALAQGGYGEEAYAAQQQGQGDQQKQMDMHIKNAQYGAQLYGAARNQEEWDLAEQKLQNLGIPTANIPREYSPQNQKMLVDSAMTLQERLNEQFRRDELTSRSLDRQEARAERRSLAGLAKEEREEKRIEEGTQRLSKDVAGTQDMLGALDEVEAELGAPVDSYTRDKSGDLFDESGKKVDLPGVSIPGLGRTSFYDSKARNLNSAASRVFNATLKDRSGGAVTDTELSRLKTEFNEGKYNTEAELIAALQRYKRQTQLVLKNREAGYKPEVVSRYTEQGGRTSQTIGAPRAATVSGGASGSWGIDKAHADDMPKIKIGAEDSGYIFKGGNPADPNSWEKK
jgi:hypothetical protein